jgi:hypothetical protein
LKCWNFTRKHFEQKILQSKGALLANKKQGSRCYSKSNSRLQVLFFNLIIRYWIDPISS